MWWDRSLRGEGREGCLDEGMGKVGKARGVDRVVLGNVCVGDGCRTGGTDGHERLKSENVREEPSRDVRGMVGGGGGGLRREVAQVGMEGYEGL